MKTVFLASAVRGGATALAVMAALMLLASCGGGGRRLIPAELTLAGASPPAAIKPTAGSVPAPGKLPESTGPGTGEGGEPLGDEPAGEPEENWPEWVIRDYYDPELGENIPIIDGRVIIAMRNPPPAPDVDPNYFDDESVPSYGDVYPVYPDVLDDPRVIQFLAETGATPFSEWLSIRAFGVLLPPGTSVESAVANWPGQYDFIEEVGPDCFYEPPAFPQDPPNDSCANYPKEDSWHLWFEDNPFCTRFGMNVVRAWQAGALGSSDVVMALADSGVQRSYFGQSYLDTVSRLTEKGANVGEYTGSSEFTVNGGQGWAWVRNKSSGAARTYGHGTNCAGILTGQVNNDPGSVRGGYNDIAGVTVYNRLFPVAMKHTTGFSSSAINCAMEAIGAVKRVYDPIQLYGVPKCLTVPHYNIEVGLVSFWGYKSNKWTKRHYENLRNFILFIQPAGNGGNTKVTYPAEYAGVLAVAAYRYTGYRASYSSYGAWVELSGPTEFLSTDPMGVNSCGATLGYVYAPGVELDEFGGTSAAGPAVAGVALLAQSRHPSWTPEQVRQRLLLSRTWLPDASIPGRLDAVLATQ